MDFFQGTILRGSPSSATSPLMRCGYCGYTHVACAFDEITGECYFSIMKKSDRRREIIEKEKEERRQEQLKKDKNFRTVYWSRYQQLKRSPYL